jgi:Icc-related predicted phosphoesterase
MKLSITADLHGYLPEIPESDLLIIAGDVLPDDNQEVWVLDQFRKWLIDLPVNKTVFIAGNHDFYFEEKIWQTSSFGKKFFEEIGATYLEDSGCQFGDLKIWGTPWVQNLSGWAFIANDQLAQEKFSMIPNDTDIVISHGPINGIFDRVGLENVGSKILASKIQKISPRVFISGHIHEDGGLIKKVGETTFINAALMNPSYKPTNQVVTLDLEGS